MPATSKAQQRLMGMALAYKQGEMDTEDASQQVKDLADSMTLQQLRDFASTSHKGLPDHVEENEVNEWLPGVAAGQKWYTQTAQSNITYGHNLKDNDDKLIKSFIEFIESGKKPNKQEQAELKEDGMSAAPASFSAPQASPANTPGMGNVAPAGPGSIGSGDKFGDDEEEEDKKKKKKYAGIVNYDQFKKTMSNKWQKQQPTKRAAQDSPQ